MIETFVELSKIIKNTWTIQLQTCELNHIYLIVIKLKIDIIWSLVESSLYGKHITSAYFYIYLRSFLYYKLAWYLYFWWTCDTEGNWSIQWVFQGNFMFQCLPDRCAKIYSTHDVWFDCFEGHIIDHVLSRLLVGKCDLQIQKI